MTAFYITTPRFCGANYDLPIEEQLRNADAWDERHGRAYKRTIALFPKRTMPLERGRVVSAMTWLRVHEPTLEQIQDAALAMMNGEISFMILERQRLLCAWAFAVFYRFSLDDAAKSHGRKQ